MMTLKPKFIREKPGLLIPLILTVITLAVYWRAGSNAFVNFDDTKYVTANPHVFTGLSLENIRWAFTTFEMGNWNPLTWISHMADCQLYGLSSRGHHYTSVFLHIANTLLLYVLLERMTGAQWRSAVVAALFALHPAHVESVAWVAERKDVLSTLFFMLTLLAYLRYVKQPGTLRYVTVTLLFVLGLMAKPMLVTLPCVLLLLDYWPLGRFSCESAPEQRLSVARGSLSRLVLEKIPLFLLTAIFSIVSIHAQKAEKALATLEIVPFTYRMANALTAYLNYIGKLFWPAHLTVFYPLPHQVPVWQIMMSIIVLAGVSVTALRWRRRFPYFIMGWLWFLGTLVPVIGLVQIGTQAMADRYTYIPYIGLFIMIAWGGAEAGKVWRPGRVILPVVVVLIVAALSVCTWLQLEHWKDSVELFSHALRHTRDNATAHLNLGNALDEKGKTAEAVQHFNEALRINPQIPNGRRNLAIAMGKIGTIEEALPHYREALRTNPADTTILCNLGIILRQRGDNAEAIKLLSECVRLQPALMKARYNLGVALDKSGRVDEAVVHYAEVLRMNPNDDETRSRLNSAVIELRKKSAVTR